MIKRTLKGLGIITCLIVSAKSSNAQSGQFDPSAFIQIKEGMDDAGKLIGAYTSPYFRGLGVGLNSGWYSSAKAHKIGRFDLTVTANLIAIPSSDQTFNIYSLGLQQLQPVDPNNVIAPTAAGAKEEGPLIRAKYNNTVQFSSPSGVDIPYFAVPNVQLSIGVGLATEVAVRFFPAMEIGKVGSISLLGLGVKHNVSNWIPALNDELFDLSVLASYSMLDYKRSLADVYDNNDINDQAINVAVAAYNVEAIVSKKIEILTLLASVGYQASASTIKMKGSYTVRDANDNQLVIKDPLETTIQGANGLKGSVGFRLKIMPVAIHAQYTFSRYSILTIGLGINIGKQ